MTPCGNCGTPNRAGVKYCKNCGAPLSSTASLPCKRCGTANPSSSLYCNRCGEKLGVTAAAPPQPGKAKQPSTANRSQTGPRATPDSTNPRNSSLPDEPHPSHAPAAKGDDRPLHTQEIPDWLSRFYEPSPSRTQLIPTHELLRMANALGVEVDYSTLRFWQKRGLVPDPVRGPVSSGRGTRGYYHPSLIHRLSFIRAIQRDHSMGLEAISDELKEIDKQIAESANLPPAAVYRERQTQLQSQRESESKRNLIVVLSKALGLDPKEIATIVIRRRDGQLIQLQTDPVRETLVKGDSHQTP